jgi:hypothetical protein
VVVGAWRRTGRVRAPVGEDGAEVEVPRGAQRRLGAQPLESALADGEGREAGRAIEALLGGAEGDVGAGRVELERVPREGRHAVDEQERVMLAARVGEPVQWLAHPGRGLAVDDEERCGAIVERRHEALGLDRPPPSTPDPFHRRAAARERVRHPLAEEPVDAADDAIAGGHEVVHHRLHPRAPGAGDGEGGAVLGDHDPAQPAHHVLHRRAKGGVEVTDGGAGERREHALGHRARTRSEEQALGELDGVDHRRLAARRHDRQATRSSRAPAVGGRKLPDTGQCSNPGSS